MTTEQLDAIMAKMPRHARYFWCTAEACMCLGCVNTDREFKRLGGTRDEWEGWVRRNPPPSDLDR